MTTLQMPASRPAHEDEDPFEEAYRALSERPSDELPRDVVLRARFVRRGTDVRRVFRAASAVRGPTLSPGLDPRMVDYFDDDDRDDELRADRGWDRSLFI